MGAPVGQCEDVVQSKEVSKGDYFKLALHDYTQYRVCPKPRVDYQINNTFYLVCIGKNYTSDFHFRQRTLPDSSLGKWALGTSSVCYISGHGGG